MPITEFGLGLGLVGPVLVPGGGGDAAEHKQKYVSLCVRK